MLKALELLGFKSFADKTRFEFPPGITVVVGPNGSGKSNVVDAIKWVLGEQSVKSLRGKEMADVIFNGSGSRKPVNSAEATLTFDNSNHLLAIDTPEVHITRRVYRSGEGEYLINRQPCRLRDIRDLFAGTGAATEAYSVIEQGKVDVLLQSSPRERRAIFEEAAGISRFKAKKLEALRRLERVDQNLLRLSDIVEEVDNRLRGVKAQASKARRYREYTDRLQELRTQVGQTDWRQLSQQLEQHERELTAYRDQVGQAAAALEVNEARALELETSLATIDEEIRACEARITRNREKIAAHETTIEHQRARLEDLEQEIARHRRHVAATSTKAGDLDQQVSQTRAELEAAEAEHTKLQQQVAADEQALAEANRQLDQLRRRIDTRRSEHMDRLRTAAMLGNQISALDQQISAGEKLLARRQEQIAELSAQRQAFAAEAEALRAAQEQLAQTALAREGELQTQQAELADSRRRLAALQKELVQLEGRLAGARERAAVLEELEKRLEGLGSGVKEVLLKARESASGPFRQIRGLVADLLNVSVETAPLVEVALGPLAQYLVVAPGPELLDHLATQSARFQGRVGFLRMDAPLPASPVDRIDLDGKPGVVGRADRLVETGPEFIPLVRRLLGRTWIVDSFAHARQLAEGAGRGLNFVTLGGELLSADGTLSVGPRQTNTGLISRRSELRALRVTIAELERSVGDLRRQTSALEHSVSQQDIAVAKLATVSQQTAQQLGEHRLKAAAAQQQLQDAEKRLETLASDLEATQSQHQTAAANRGQAGEKLTATEAEIAALESEIEQASTELAQREAQRAARSHTATEGRVELAKSEQQVGSLRRQKQQLERDKQERRRTLEETESQLQQALVRAQQARQSVLEASAAVAELYLQKEALSVETVGHINRREDERVRRAELAVESQKLRSQVRKLEEKIHHQELAANEIRHQRTTLAERLRDDYGIEIADLDQAPTAEEAQQREEVEQEIAELRRKINQLGNVNLEALAEVDELESRFGALSAQYGDLTKAKASLEQIIGKINADSRRLFAETLETVCGHFQVLFRKLFGGGQADILLDDHEDILESGIEIVARPPGKEPRSISLLSGGEKTLTCVALLLAIFKSRPSPFCVLDEVDAALDEANIERFVGVVKEFLSWTQFIIVTHSKKTMTCASTLYGVTMQESGISKRVSVHFDDVSEDGHIRREALEREAASDDETAAA